MIEVFFSSLYSIIGAILLASFVGYVSWRNNFKVRRANACAVFRSAVLSELGLIYPKPAVWPENIDVFLRSHFTALQIAVENFRPFVPWWNRYSFERAWFRYRCSTGRKVDVQCYHHYMAFGDNPNYKAIFYANVSFLLSFANET